MGENEDVIPGLREEIVDQPSETHHLKGLLKLKCGCGSTSTVSEEVIEDGLNWTMLIGEDHFIAVMCPDCGAKLTMYIEEITESDELPKESIEE